MNSYKNKCPICGGRKIKGTSVYSVDLEGCLIVVRNVAAEICGQCGEEWLDNETARELERITDEAINTLSSGNCYDLIISISIRLNSHLLLI